MAYNASSCTPNSQNLYDPSGYLHSFQPHLHSQIYPNPPIHSVGQLQVPPLPLHADNFYLEPFPQELRPLSYGIRSLVPPPAQSSATACPFSPDWSSTVVNSNGCWPTNSDWQPQLLQNPKIEELQPPLQGERHSLEVVPPTLRVSTPPLQSPTEQLEWPEYKNDLLEKKVRKIPRTRLLPASSIHKPFTCQLCGKSFSQAANLTAHRRVHTGEKPFRCPVCRRPFSQSSSLVTHKRTHSGERPYNCPHCDKAFTDSSTLTKHLRTHTGQKPYGCIVCHMRFTQSGNLHRHMNTHK